MLRRLKVFLVLGMWTIPAAAQEPKVEPAPVDLESDQAGAVPAAPAEPTEKPTSKDQKSDQAGTEPAAPKESTDRPTSNDQKSDQAGTEPTAPPPAAEVKPVEQLEGWHTFVTGYFRAPMALGVSSRPGPDNMTGPSSRQVSYGPNRTIDANYYSFAYTRLQEQDWAELFIHAKKKHVQAVVGWMGYWYGGAGFRNPDSSWFPGMAYVTLDTDVEVTAGFKPNIALTVGAFWPSFGTFAKYDTYTLGRFRQLGEQVKLTVPLNPDLTVTLVQGFGTARDGSFVYQINPPIYGAKTGVDLMHYEHVQLTYKKYVDIGLHYNQEWTSDPNLFQQATTGKAYTDVSQAHLSVLGAEVGLRAPYAGRLWISPSYVTVKNGWALGANGGTEVMHSLGGAGVATNYMAWTNSPADSTGSGSMVNLGFLYENSLSSILDKTPGSVMPEVTLNVFGLLSNASLDLPTGSVVRDSQGNPQKKITQFKYGADATLQALNWLGFMLRYDTVNYDLDHPGYIFSAISSRVIFSSHFLSSESIYLQYSRYRYGDMMVLNGPWPWGSPLVAGSDIIQSGSYSGQKPDADIFKVQANVAF